MADQYLNKLDDDDDDNDKDNDGWKTNAACICWLLWWIMKFVPQNTCKWGVMWLKI